MISVKTKRQTLRPLYLEDAASLLPYFSDSETCRYIPWEPRDLSGVEAFLDKWTNGRLPQNEEESLILGIDLPGTGVIGQLNMTLKSTQHKHAEFGYVLNPAFRGEGYASEAVHGFVSYLFESLNLHRLSAYVDERNKSSIKLLQNLGFRLEGRFVENEYFKGEWVTMLTFAMLASDWPEARRGSNR